MNGRAFFVTGTDTGVGKTLVATALLRAAGSRGWSTLGLKPVAAGGDEREGTFMNEDARCLRDAASIRLNYSEVNPVALREPIAPHIAAQREDVLLSAAQLAARCRAQLAASQPEFAVVEGAGGWLVPLGARETMADLASELGLPVIIVLRLRLGCLNHALLTSAAIRSAGLPLAGWVASATATPMAAQPENLAALSEWLPAPCIGVLPWLGDAPDLARAADCLDLSRLAANR